MGLPYSVYTRTARLALVEKGVAYRFETVDVFAETGPSAAYLRVNPFGRIPALVHGDFSLYETAAITKYVDEGFAGPALQPESAKNRALMHQLIGIADAYAYRTLVWDVFVERISKPHHGEEPDESRIAGALARARLCVEQLGVALEPGGFLTGRRLSLADLHLWPMLKYFSLTPEGCRLLEGSALTPWLQAMETRESVRSTVSTYG